MKTIHGQMTVRRALLLMGAAGAFGLTGPAARAVGRSEVLAAIHVIENPRNLTRPGPCGELGAYQFREATWRMHSELRFVRALDRVVSDEVAVRHYEWLRRGLERAGRPVTVTNIALAWNAGLHATVRGRVPEAARDYAERVANIAADFRTERVGEAK